LIFNMRPILRGLLLVCVALFAAGCDSAPEEGGGPGMMGGRGPVAVVTAKVTAESFADGFDALGSVRANEAVDIKSRISSVVTGIHFIEGQQVTEGDLLVTLDDREIAAQLAVAQATYEKVRSQYQRSDSLRATQVVSEAELDELAADVRRAEADVTAARARLDHCSIRAPISGVVGLRHISRGGLVGPDTLITTLDDIDEVKLHFAVPESYLATVRNGMQVNAATSVYPDEKFSGTVVTIDSRIDPVTRSVTVVARVANDSGILKPGMFMNVALKRERESVVLLPEAALSPRSGRQFVFIVEDGVASEREVSLGVRAPGRVEVKSGLEPGDTVVLEGVQKLRNGSPVTEFEPTS
jgi:membrane fusion protein (multidrug efflux system)